MEMGKTHIYQFGKNVSLILIWTRRKIDSNINVNVNLTLVCVEKTKQKTSNLLKQRGGMQPVEAYLSNKPMASSEGDHLIVDSSRQQGK